MDKRVSVVFVSLLVAIAIGAFMWAQITLVSSRAKETQNPSVLSKLREEVIKVVDCKQTLDAPFSNDPNKTIWLLCRNNESLEFSLRGSTGIVLTSPTYQWRNLPFAVRGACTRGSVFVQVATWSPTGTTGKWEPLFSNEVDLFRTCR